MTVPAMTIGLATAGTGAFAGQYGTALVGTGALSGAVTASPLSSILPVANGSLRVGGGQASLFGQAMNNASMAWRQATGTDTAPAALPAGTTFLASDVVDVGAMSGAFALQMKYDASLFGGHDAGAGAIGKLFLGYMSGGVWVNAGNTTLSSYNQGNATLASVVGNASSLTGFVGDWGYDPSSQTVWAVRGSQASDTQFAVPAAIPEPSTLALLAAGGIAVGLVWRRRKKA
jgi:hypothetical protein